jgi:hypothetical protein
MSLTFLCPASKDWPGTTEAGDREDTSVRPENLLVLTWDLFVQLFKQVPSAPYSHLVTVMGYFMVNDDTLEIQV